MSGRNGVAIAAASNVSNLFNDVLCLNAKYIGNVLCHTVTAGYTKVCQLGRAGFAAAEGTAFFQQLLAKRQDDL